MELLEVLTVIYWLRAIKDIDAGMAQGYGYWNGLRSNRAKARCLVLARDIVLAFGE